MSDAASLILCALVFYGSAAMLIEGIAAMLDESQRP